MKESKKCPICRQHDFYLEGENFEIEDRGVEQLNPFSNLALPSQAEFESGEENSWYD
jgi:hypothetical protein